MSVITQGQSPHSIGPLSTGAKKFDTDKPDTAIFPPLSFIGISRVLGMGKRKYGSHNWRGGIEYSRLLGAALRHIFAYLGGEDVDPESGLSHIHHAACNLVFLGEFIEEGRTELDDRYRPSIKATD